MAEPAAYSFTRYLAAKKSLDDRSLNRQVWNTMAREVKARQDASALKVLEVGCGSGAMLERLLAGGVLTRAAYTGIDLEPDTLAAAGERLEALAAAQGALLSGQHGVYTWRRADQEVTIEFSCADLLDFARQGPAAWDLLLAHAVLDLLHLPTALPLLLARLRQRGLFYFTLNFDGITAFQPPLDLRLDALIETLYHRTMDERRVAGRPSGDSLTGRHLLQHLRDQGATLLAAGSSDWVATPLAAGYCQDEAYFLHYLIDTVHRALTGHPLLPAGPFRDWVRERHAQVERQELSYIAHQLDFLGYI
jgi:SAM-dependent methyltransferase